MNLIGYSAEAVNLSLSSATFHDGTTEYTWAQALANNKQQAYLAYYDSNSQANLSKYKYLSTLSGFDDTAFRNNKGYWIYSNVSGNLTLPSVGGSLNDETYLWNKLRFGNGSEEKGVADAVDDNWLEKKFKYTTGGTAVTFIDICGSTSFPDSCDKTNLSSWEGIFVKSNVDNLTLIRQN